LIVSAQTVLHVTLPEITYGGNLPAARYSYGVAVGGGGVGATGVLADADGIGVKVGAFTSTVGAAMVGNAAVLGAPVNRKTVPNTMLTATRPFNPIDAYHRQFFCCDFGFALLGIPNSLNFKNDYTTIRRSDKFVFQQFLFRVNYF
jgi:hypothetical protein